MKDFLTDQNDPIIFDMYQLLASQEERVALLAEARQRHQSPVMLDRLAVRAFDLENLIGGGYKVFRLAAVMHRTSGIYRFGFWHWHGSVLLDAWVMHIRYTHSLRRIVYLNRFGQGEEYYRVYASDILNVGELAA